MRTGNGVTLAAMIFLIALFVSGAVLLNRNIEDIPDIIEDDDGLVACTMDARICPDGSSVGRIPPSCEFAPCPTGSATPSQPDISGWNSYLNSEYAFSLLYPDSYQVLEDDLNLSGWPNGVVILHKGGQAYDIVVELWDSQSEYREQFASRGTTNFRFFVLGDNYLTISANTDEPENSTIISTFSPR